MKRTVVENLRHLVAHAATAETFQGRGRRCQRRRRVLVARATSSPIEGRVRYVPCANRRRGAAIVEFAVVAPLLFLLALGLTEYGRVEMVIQAMTTAAQEGCRAGIVPGSTSADVASQADDALRGGLVSGARVTVNPPEIATLKQGQSFTVTVQVAMDAISWVPSPVFLKGKVLTTQCTMVRESK